MWNAFTINKLLFFFSSHSFNAYGRKIKPSIRLSKEKMSFASVLKMGFNFLVLEDLEKFGITKMCNNSVHISKIKVTLVIKYRKST